MKSWIKKRWYQSEIWDRRLQIKDMWSVPQNSTVLIHIGKSGGRTIKNGIQNATQNKDVYEVHIRKPIYRPDLKYIIIARNPISRVQSAFRWRYKWVVEEGKQRDRFHREYEVLVKYGTLNNLAEALYDEDGSINKMAQKDIRHIHHIREDISFYLAELLQKCLPEQIEAVLMQENLDEDIFKVFGYHNELTSHRNPDIESKSSLSDLGIKNLMHFFRQDYEILTKLYCWGKLDREVFFKVM